MVKHIISTAIVTGALSVVPLAAFAASSQAQPHTQAKHSNSTTGTHATRGVVKSVDATTLVITRSDKKKSVMTFTMDSSTNRPDGVAVGTPVSVRYREEGKSHVATAVSVEQGKAAAKQTASKG